MPTGYPNGRIGYSNFGQGTPKMIGVQDTSVELLAANPNRLYAEITNNGAHDLWLGFGEAAVVGQGACIRRNGMRNFVGNELYLGAIYAITDQGTVETQVIEGV